MCVKSVVDPGGRSGSRGVARQGESANQESSAIR